MNQSTMNGQNSSTSGQNNSSIQHAEEILTKSISRFESAIENLSHRVETTSQSLHHVLDMAETHRADLGKLKTRATEVIDPLLPLIRQAGDWSRTFTLQVKANPKRYVWSFIGIVGGIFAWNYFESPTTTRSVGSLPSSQLQ